MIVAIHQPNYFPWLGYFKKILEADIFILLDDAQFSKGSYTNRVRISKNSGVRWLTLPVTYKFGQPINKVCVASVPWKKKHLDILRQTYRGSPHFEEVWNDLEEMFKGLSSHNLSVVNQYLIHRVIACLGFQADFRLASTFNIKDHSDDKLISLIQKVTSQGVYLSGDGGKDYQSVGKFELNNISVRYLDFIHPLYTQFSTDAFLPGLSVLDAAFNIGWKKTGQLLVQSIQA